MQNHEQDSVNWITTNTANLMTPLRVPFFDAIVMNCVILQGLAVAIIVCFCNAEVHKIEMFQKQTMRESFIVNIFLHMQAQAALHRKWVQWKSNCGKSKWFETTLTSSHSASITETSCTSLGPAAAASALSVQNFLSQMHLSTKRQEKSKICSNGDVDMSNSSEAPVI